ncbi:MAG: hypothetical protein MI919_09825, partial [Holophagales bacterium]|nr:hypothetical protein [Holophagales bacterium]
NVEPGPTPIDIELTHDDTLLDDGIEIFLDLGSLYPVWQTGGGLGTNIDPIPATTRVRVTGFPARLENLAMAPREEHLLSFSARAEHPVDRPGESYDFYVDVAQYVGPQRVGGVSTIIRARGRDADTDGDGTPDIVDTDDDNDGIPDTEDPDPLDGMIFPDGFETGDITFWSSSAPFHGPPLASASRPASTPDPSPSAAPPLPQPSNLAEGEIVFRGLPHGPVGSAELRQDDPGVLTVDLPDTVGGVAIRADGAEALVLELAPNFAGAGSDARLRLEVEGELGGLPDAVGSLDLRRVGDELELTPVFGDGPPGPYELTLFLDGAVVHTENPEGGPAGRITAGATGSVWVESFAAGLFALRGFEGGYTLPGGETWPADEVTLRSAAPPELDRRLAQTRVLGESLGSFEVRDLELFRVGLVHRALGSTRLEVLSPGLLISELGSGGESGAAIDLGRAAHVELEVLSDPPAGLLPGSWMAATFWGVFDDATEAPVLETRLEKAGGQWAAHFDFSALGAGVATVEVLAADAVVATWEAAGEAARFYAPRLGFEASGPEPDAIGPGLALAFEAPIEIHPPGGSPVMGDRLRASPAVPLGPAPFVHLSRSDVKGMGPPSFVVESEAIGLLQMAEKGLDDCARLTLEACVPSEGGSGRIEYRLLVESLIGPGACLRIVDTVPPSLGSVTPPPATDGTLRWNACATAGVTCQVGFSGTQPAPGVIKSEPLTNQVEASLGAGLPQTWTLQSILNPQHPSRPSSCEPGIQICDVSLIFAYGFECGLGPWAEAIGGV